MSRMPANSRELNCEHPFLLAQFKRANDGGVVVESSLRGSRELAHLECPLRLRPRRRAILVVVPVSSRKISRCGSSRMIGWRVKVHSSRIGRFFWRRSPRRPTSPCRSWRPNWPPQPARRSIPPRFRVGSSALAIASKTYGPPRLQGDLSRLAADPVCINVSGLEELPPAMMEIRTLRSS